MGFCRNVAVQKHVSEFVLCIMPLQQWLKIRQLVGTLSTAYPDVDAGRHLPEMYAIGFSFGSRVLSRSPLQFIKPVVSAGSSNGEVRQ